MQLTSYGGDLSYRVYYEVDGYDIPTNNPDVILEVFFTSSSNLSLNYFKKKYSKMLFPVAGIM